jgi:hypothetical protein
MAGVSYDDGESRLRQEMRFSCSAEISGAMELISCRDVTNYSTYADEYFTVRRFETVGQFNYIWSHKCHRRFDSLISVSANNISMSHDRQGSRKSHLN